MDEEDNNSTARVEPRITAEAPDIEGITSVRRMEFLNDIDTSGFEDYPEELREVMQSLNDIYIGV